MTLAIVLVLLVIGSVLFHFISPWWFTPIASNWATMDQTVNITFYVTGTVFVVVNLFMAYCVIRYRHRKGQQAHYEPESKRLEWVLTIVTAVGVAAMLTPGLFVWAKFVNVPKDAAIVEVVGQQWHWGFRFPGADGQLGATDAKLMTDANPFGMNPDDPKGRDDVLVSDPELHLPLNRPVKLLLRSKDVLHDFAVRTVPREDGHGARAWSPTCGSRRPRRASTRFSARSSAASPISRCGAAWWSMTRTPYQAWLAARPTFASITATAAADVECRRCAVHALRCLPWRGRARAMRP